MDRPPHWSQRKRPPPPATWEALEAALLSRAHLPQGRTIVSPRLQTIASQAPFLPPEVSWGEILTLAWISGGEEAPENSEQGGGMS